MNPAFDRHAAYMEQAWRTMEDSLLLKYRGAGFTHEGRPIQIDPPTPFPTVRQPVAEVQAEKVKPPQITDWSNQPPPMVGTPEYKEYKEWVARKEREAKMAAKLTGENRKKKRSQYYDRRATRANIRRSEGKSSALENSWHFLKQSGDENIPNTMREYAAEGRCAKCGTICTSCNTQPREEGATWSDPRLDKRWLELWRRQKAQDALTTASEDDEQGV